MLTSVTLSSKNQMTLPKRIVDFFGLEAGDELAVTIKKDTKEIILRPRTGRLSRLFGMLSDVKIPKGKSIDNLIEESQNAYLEEKYTRLGFLRKAQ